jgi:NAD(P)-dependent dehydrogenase (short-subunit alcohol dehydrogenase family)
MTMPNFRLDQQTALVTGAASGIGRSIAVGLAAAGADVACFDLSGSALDEVCAQIERKGRRALAVSGDVTDAVTLTEAVQNTQRSLGPLSLAVNSAESPTAHRRRRCHWISGSD